MSIMLDLQLSFRQIRSLQLKPLVMFWIMLFGFGLNSVSDAGFQDGVSNESNQEGQSDISIFQLDDGSVEIRHADDLFARFNFKDYGKPILYPLMADGQIEMTRNYPMKKDVPGEANDHPHHKSVWIAHGDVNGFDFWTEKQKIECRSIEIDGPVLSIVNHWIANEESLVIEETQFRFSKSDNLRIIDVSILFRPAVESMPLVFGDTKEGFFAVRTHPSLRLVKDERRGVTQVTGQAMNSNGDRDGSVWGKRAAWVYYWGEIDETPVGIGLIDHAKNFRYPSTWHARDYGLIAANPFGLHEFLQMPPGSGSQQVSHDEPLQLRYRIVISAGHLEAAAMDRIASEFE